MIEFSPFGMLGLHCLEPFSFAAVRFVLPAALSWDRKPLQAYALHAVSRLSMWLRMTVQRAIVSHQ